MITNAEEMAKWVRDARARGVVALDTEFVWERTYYPRLGIVQIALSAEECELIDAVALSDLGGLGELLADASVVKVLHDAQQDLTILRRATGAHPRNVFDTRCAAGMVLGSSTLSLTALVQQTVGVELAGGATRTDWLRRPLAGRQVSYALDDVRHLPRARQTLLERAEGLGREGWIREELATYEDPAQYDEPDPQAQFERVKGGAKLSARKLGVLRELAAWREEEAARRDIPRRHVAPDKVLVDAAVRTPRSLSALARIKGDYDRERCGPPMLEAIERGLAINQGALPQREERPDDDESLGARVDFLLSYLKGKGFREAVDPALVASRAEVTALVREGPDAEPRRHRLLRGWRGEFMGEDLRRLLTGEQAVRLDEATGLPELAPATPPRGSSDLR